MGDAVRAAQLSPGTASVLWTDLGDVTADPTLLSDAERGRAAAMAPEVADHWVRTRTWVRRTLGRTLAADPAAIVIAADPQGRPTLPDHPEGHLSISHCPHVVALALAAAPLGVDVEDLPGPGVDLAQVAAVVGAPSEQAELADVRTPDRPRAFQRWWTRKEAVLKAEGTGFLREPREVTVGVTTTTPPAPWVVHDLGLLPASGSPALALATHGPAVVTVLPPPYDR
ncbi:4'-phosphopantetheinyl transferase family protein [Ornithinimicrobium panacihumi]|uniref:4'-phosphopantetheinyl transferase family protein n=1 Tax=Ornithinimicrobium panacihumi TaxID=2008449 RepID=UPI003F895D3D